MPEHIKSLLEAASKLPSAEQFVEFCKKAMDVIAQSEVKLFEHLDTRQAQDQRELAALKLDIEDTLQQVKSASESTLTSLKSRALESIDALFTKLRLNDKFDAMIRLMMNEHAQKMRELQGQMDSKVALIPSKEEFLALIPPEEPDETAEETRDKLETLEGDDRLDASAIKNLPEVVKSFPNALIPHALLNHMDVDFSGIATGQSIKWDGVRWIPFTPAGGANTPIYEEVVSGSATTFTLAHTPASGTLRLYANGQRIALTTDYTLSGATITTISSWSAGVILADYEYT